MSGVCALNADVPLCVDLDNTLVQTDTLVEGLLSICTTSKIFGLLRVGTDKAALKAYVADHAEIDVTLLPYNMEIVEFLRQQAQKGRYIVLVTAANLKIANAVSDHLGLFDEVIASDGKNNLRGKAKSDRLVSRFGRKFCYMGDHHTDLLVWKCAQQGIPVNLSQHVSKQYEELRIPTERRFLNKPSLAYNIIKSLRPHQWAKNVLVFVPILTANALTDMQAWIGALLMFVSFCATASSIYIVNDLTDIEADRHHPRKRSRPFASGSLSANVGAIIALALLSFGLLTSALAGTLLIILIYAALSLSYSAVLKEKALVDVFILAALYTIRIFGGGSASHHYLSFWLLGFSGFMFLSLAFIKRYQECKDALEQGRVTKRRDYKTDDLPTLRTLGIASTFASSVVLALFVQNEIQTLTYKWPALLWGLVPILLFWQCRLWLVTTRGEMHDDPIVYAAHDRGSWLAAGVAFVCLILAKSVRLHLFGG